MKQGLILPRAGQQPCPKNFIITAISHPKRTQFRLQGEEKVRVSQRGKSKIERNYGSLPKIDLEYGTRKGRASRSCPLFLEKCSPENSPENASGGGPRWSTMKTEPEQWVFFLSRQ